jgi:hypothetical protein
MVAAPSYVLIWSGNSYLFIYLLSSRCIGQRSFRFGPSLPHDSILAVLEFFGMPDLWLNFFKKWLGAKLKFGGVSEPQTRARGVPIAHSLSVSFISLFTLNQLYLLTGARSFAERPSCSEWTLLSTSVPEVSMSTESMTTSGSTVTILQRASPLGKRCAGTHVWSVSRSI